MVPLALDRLIIHPYLITQIDTEVFGGFIWVLGIVTLFGSVGASGFVTILMREHANQEPRKAQILFRSSLALCLIATAVLISIACLASVPFADSAVRANAWALYVPLAFFALCRAVSLVVIANLRIKRRFRTIFLLRLLEATSLLLVLYVARFDSLWLIGAVYILSTLVIIPVGAITTRDVFAGGRWWESGVARLLVGGWYAGALISVIDQSQVYVSRLLLGAISTGEQVAILYAGTAMGNIFVMPVTILAVLMLSLLGGRSSFVFTRATATWYVAGAVSMAALVAASSWFLGRWLVENRYPSLAPTTLQFYHWIALANGMTCIMLMLRPVALRYAPLLRTSIITCVPLTLQIALLAAFIPSRASHGAAMALAIAEACSAVVWIIYFCWICSRFNRNSSSSPSDTDRDSSPASPPDPPPSSAQEVD